MEQKINTAFSTDLITLAAEVIVGNSFGSGIYIEKGNQVFFCTARHVLFNNMNPKGMPKYQLKKQLIEIKSYPKNTDYSSFEKVQVDLELLISSHLLSFNGAVDICAFKIADIVGRKLILVPGVQKVSKTISLNVASSRMVKPTQAIAAGEELYVIGYPKALQLLNKKQPFYDYNLPLVRKGITSCMNDYKTFVIDCAVFGGNSGGPVFIAENLLSTENGQLKIRNKRYLIGIAIQYIPLLNMTAKRMNPRSQAFNHAENSGYGVCVSFNELQKEITKIEGMKSELS